MFTGIVEEIGTVLSTQDTGGDLRVVIEAKTVLADAQLGDSIAVSGCCLTVVAITETAFAVELSKETVAKTAPRWRVGARVNLERAMRATSRFGGHIVSGHVEGVGEVLQVRNEPGAYVVTVRAPEALGRYFIAVNTVLLDDPLLTSRPLTKRPLGAKSPRKVIFDSVARTPLNAKLFDPDPAGDPAQVTLFVTGKAPAARVAALRERGAEVVLVPELRGRTDVRGALLALKELGVQSLLLEGGGTLAWSFFEAQAVDKVAFFIGPKLLGGGGSSPLGGLGVTEMEDALTLDGLETETIDGDILVTGRVRYPLQEPAEIAETEGR